MVSIEMVGKEVMETLKKIADTQIAELTGEILRADRVFVAGAGRSGMMARCFVMRLMHLGLKAYMVGEVVTPAFASGDLLLITSGSGSTGSLVQMAKKARKIGGRIALVTVYPDSEIGQMADTTVQIDAPTKKINEDRKNRPLQPMGNLFEQCLLICLDYVGMCLMEKLGMEEEEMFSRHANLE
ncbi:MAG: 6-phospho-3-hexuloisomerase [Blautia sp.]|jgi:6-phospho-3-hexuloisomerase